MDLLTIGHSNHTIKAFICLLHQHRVTAIADVRSHPYSRYLSHFNQAALRAALKDQGIHYGFLGQELGARPNDPDCYVAGKAVYEKIAATEAFSQGIQRVLKGRETYKIALMCAEKDPLTCHRAILICQHLRHFDLAIAHILSDGELETHHHLEDRMLAKHRFHDVSQDIEQVHLSLFSDRAPSREDCLITAYRLQGDEIAYIEKQATNHDPSN